MESALPIFAGLGSGIAFIILFSTIGTSALSLYSHYSQYNLGTTKDELVSRLSEYFSREPDNAVRITHEYRYDATLYDGVHDLYAYGLVADYDSKDHGTLRIFTYHNELNVQAVSIQWITREPKLQNATDLMVSGIADNTIPDWQADDGQPNRNVQMLNWIHANTECMQRPVVKDDLSQERKLYLSACEGFIPLLMVSVEP